MGLLMDLINLVVETNHFGNNRVVGMFPVVVWFFRFFHTIHNTVPFINISNIFGISETENDTAVVQLKRMKKKNKLS